MKNITYSFILLLVASNFTFAQKDSLQVTDFEPYTYHFQIENGEIVGEGKTFIETEMAKPQYVLLGEYHGSYHISKFTTALLPILAKNGFQTFGLEVGPISGQILSELAKEEEATIQKIYDFNNKYYIKEEEDYYGPIPFFEHVEDAEFLAQAATQNWQLIGLDQEFIYGYEPLFDRMYQNLNTAQQKQSKALYKEVKDSLIHFYALEATGEKDLAAVMYESPLIEQFLNKMIDQNTENQPIAEAVRATAQIYYYYATRQWLRCNSTRIDYMKQCLREGWEHINFDPAEDKMLLKMGGIHTERGFSNLSLFEIGNTLSELAAFHGNTSLHLGFNSRYYEKDGKTVDMLAEEQYYAVRYKEFLQMAKPNRWTIIDLRPMKNDVFYRRKYLMERHIEQVFEGDDWMVFPPSEIETTFNFEERE